MPVQKRGNKSWRITISNGFNIHGERVRITKTVCAVNKTEAEKMEKILTAEIVKKGSMTPSKMTLKEFFDYWLKNYALPQLADKTIASYKDLYRRVDIALGHKPIDKIEPKHMLLFFKNLRQCPRMDGKEGTLSSATQRKTYAMLHVLFQTALKWGFIIANPIDAVDAPKHRYKNNKIILDREAVGTFLLLLRQVELKYRIWCSISIMCGLRREEIYGLQWRHVDFDKSTLKIEQACVYTKGKGVTIKNTKNDFSERTISVPHGFMEELKKYKQSKTDEKARLANLWQGADAIEKDFLFTTWNGRVAHPDTITKWLHKFVVKHDLPHITPHSFRHMTATFLINAGVDLTTVAGKLGHANSTTTQIIYSHLLDKSEKETANTMEAILSQSMIAASELNHQK